FATAKLLETERVLLREVGLIEINEAFAAQVLACEAAFASNTFAEDELGMPRALGEINPERRNVNGGAIALGHPVGATGARLVQTLLLEMQKRDVSLGLVTLCIGGGQGAAVLLERA
ncbi:MAG TPA: acetyl-CoA C-acyltransferase, partial [Candidatus Eisenbacteria bacterium]|nr:acetyl-CoA C-acyltransferase [Candidatus Eisenbacteria bacterium]